MNITFDDSAFVTGAKAAYRSIRDGTGEALQQLGTNVDEELLSEMFERSTEQQGVEVHDLYAEIVAIRLRDSPGQSHGEIDPEMDAINAEWLQVDVRFLAYELDTNQPLEQPTLVGTTWRFEGQVSICDGENRTDNSEL